MKIFFDTCAIVDFICNRENAPYIDRILNDSEKRGWERYISVGSFYTLTYLIEIHLKRNGYEEKETRIEKLREILSSILQYFNIAELTSNKLFASIKDYAFSDLEDSYQYRAAITAKCDFLITDNISDFKNADMTKIRIVSPKDFITPTDQ